MKFLVLIPAAISVFWAIMMLAKKGKLRAHVYMAAALLVFAVAYVLFFNLLREGSRMWQCILYMAFALSVPCMHYTFFRSAIVVEKTDMIARYVVPVNLAFMAIYTVLVIIQGSSISDIFYHSYILGENVAVPEACVTRLWKALEFLTFGVFNALLAIEGVSFLVWTFVKIIRYDRLIDEHFAGREEEEKKNNFLVFLSLVFSGILLVALLVQPFYVIRDDRMILIVCVILSSISSFITGLYSYRIRFTAENLRMMIDEDNEKKKLADEISKEQHIGFEQQLDETFLECQKRLDKAVSEDMVYLDPELSLISLSDILETNRTYLSKLINLNFNCSFSEFVNNLRVDYAVRKIKEEKRTWSSLKELSEACGYSTQASFIRNFTKITGMTPSQFVAEEDRKRYQI